MTCRSYETLGKLIGKVKYARAECDFQHAKVTEPCEKPSCTRRLGFFRGIRLNDSEWLCHGQVVKQGFLFRVSRGDLRLPNQNTQTGYVVKQVVLVV